ncbi:MULTISPECIES: DUF945 family protein [unclassified Halomonas]|uniref:DUF945 family protein n=1 Tax=unclassified Halomonas TaxID=2609666 RepID=UPI0003B87195|nr:MULTISPECIES: DUF945 family protein [unclassified Halomonas]ERS87733.1 hypothetical protein Q671_02020 [Halomonas sp. PBN3]
MRKERLIVPVVVGLALVWAVAQYAASLLFERELARTLADLEARGELVVEREDVERGWLSSSGRMRIAPLLGDAWQLAFTYEARHGVLSTRLEGELSPTLGPAQRRLFGDALPSRSPRWHARYQTLGGTLEGSLGLAPFVVRQGERELDFQGGQVTFGGEYGDWWLRARLQPLRLTDGVATLEAGPASLESRYAYTEGAYHFTQHDLLRLERLAWRQPDLALDGSELLYRSRMQLDDSELVVDGELEIGQVLAAEQVLLTGRVAATLSRLDAEALRTLLRRLREEVMRAGSDTPTPRELIARLEPELKALLADSPRVDVTTVDLDSPMLGITARGEGTLIFDPRRLDELAVSRLDDPAEQARWRSRLDGDFVWHQVPTVVALWLGLPLDTRELAIDVVRGKVRVNGRPLPPLWR